MANCESFVIYKTSREIAELLDFIHSPNLGEDGNDLKSHFHKLVEDGIITSEQLALFKKCLFSDHLQKQSFDDYECYKRKKAIAD